MLPINLSGPNGTVNTTVIKLIAVAGMDTFELSPFIVSIEPSVRRSFLHHLRIRGSLTGEKACVLDEIDLLPKSLFRSIKCAIDEYGGHVRFVATTNNISAIDNGLRSRALCLQMAQAPLERWLPRIRSILDAENVPIPKRHMLQEMLDGSGGDNREFLADLQLYVEGVQAAKFETA